MEQNSQHRENETLEEKVQKTSLSSFYRTESTQTIEFVFTDTIEQFRKTKVKLELIKIVDCFLDGHGNYFSKMISSKIKI